MERNANQPVKEITVSAVIVRACSKCGAPGVANGVVLERCARCGTPITREDQGVVASWHRNPLVRALRKWRGQGSVSVNEIADSEEL